jgi:hypothetical protein
VPKETLNIKIRKIARAAMLKQSEMWRKFANKVFSRASAANLLMIAFILLSGVGAFMIYPPAGFIVSGTACGLFGYILGLD